MGDHSRAEDASREHVAWHALSADDASFPHFDRAPRPKLAAFGVGGLLTDPKLQIYDSDQRTVITNNDWNGADFVSELVTAAGYVGAFALDNNSTDSASLALLQPGGYTVPVVGQDNGSGLAIVEIYEVP